MHIHIFNKNTIFPLYKLAGDKKKANSGKTEQHHMCYGVTVIP